MERGGVAATDEIILCPSLFDALTFWNAGYRNVTCTFGADALTEDHLAAFRQFGIRRVLASAEAVVPRLIAAGIECYLLAMPIGLDANQYALQAADPAQALGGAIRKAVWQGKGASPTVPVVNAPPAVPDATDDADDDDVHEPADGGLNDDDLDDLSDDDWDDLEDDDGRRWPRRAGH